MDCSTRNRLLEIEKQIQVLQEEQLKLNPFIHLKRMSSKEFGEEFSEKYILDHVPNLVKDNGAGHDMFSNKLGYIEVKSGRLPYKSTWTMNQLHPHQCDYYLFVFYNTEEADVFIYLVPSQDIVNRFTLSFQHSTNGECYSMSGSKKNCLLLEEYQIQDWNELNLLV